MSDENKENDDREENFALPELVVLPKEVKKARIPFMMRNLYFENEEDEKWIDSHRGPTDYSNWLICDKLMMSARPTKDEDLQSIVKEGIRVFICLQLKNEARIFRDYKSIVSELAGSDRTSFYNFEVQNYCTPSFDTASKFVETVYSELRNGNKVLVHCLGGRGRTGTLIGCFLAEYYRNLSGDDILRYVQASYDCRLVRRGPCPENDVQRDFIRDYARLRNKDPDE